MKKLHVEGPENGEMGRFIVLVIFPSISMFDSFHLRDTEPEIDGISNKFVNPEEFL